MILVELPSRVKTEVNPAYETVAVQSHGAVLQSQTIYENVW